MSPHKNRGRHSRGYLPHFDPGSIVQTLVFNLNDAMPIALVNKWKRELAERPEDERKKELFERAEKYLDLGLGNCYLAIPQIANLVNDAVSHFEGERYLLFAWSIMPNHVHLVLRPNEGVRLEDIVHSIKSYTSSEANKFLGRNGRFWQPDYFDRFVRDRVHFQNAINYVENNPVKARLCGRKNLWRWSSAYDGDL